MDVAATVIAKLRSNKLADRGYQGWLLCECGHYFNVPLMRICLRGSGPCPECKGTEELKLIKGTPEDHAQEKDQA